MYSEWFCFHVWLKWALVLLHAWSLLLLLLLVTLNRSYSFSDSVSSSSSCGSSPNFVITATAEERCKRLDLCWPQWVHFGSQEHHRTSWNLIESHGTSWNLMEFHRTSWNLMEGSGTWRNLLVADKWLQMMTSLNVSRTFQKPAVCL
jgi:hypothetical protein